MELWKLKAPVSLHGSKKLTKLINVEVFLQEYMPCVHITSFLQSTKLSQTLRDSRHAQNFNIPSEVALDVNQQQQQKRKRLPSERHCACERFFICHKMLKKNASYVHTSTRSLIKHWFDARAWAIHLLMYTNLFPGGLFVFIYSEERTGNGCLLGNFSD